MYKVNGNEISFTNPIVELYLPFDYIESGLFTRVGQHISVYGIGNIRVFNKDSELATRDSKKTYPLTIPSYLDTNPSEVDIDEVSLYPNSTKRKCIILRYYKGDVFIMNKFIIKSIDNVTVLFNRFLGGKLDILPYMAQLKTLEDNKTMNNLNYRIASEDEEAIVAERCRLVSNPNKKARFSDKYVEEVLAVNPRVDVNMSSTFNMLNFEDINTAMVVASNQKRKGVKNQESIIERLVKGEKVDI